MDIPLTMSNIKQIRISDRDPGKKTKEEYTKKRFLILAGVSAAFQLQKKEPRPPEAALNHKA